MEKKLLKIKWKSAFKLIILAICIYTLIHDFYMLTFYSLINKVTVTWTSTGLLTFVLSGLLSEHLINEIFN